MLKTGTTTWDAEDRLCGCTDLPATDESLSQCTQTVLESKTISELRTQMNAVLCGPSDVSMQCAQLLAGSHDIKIKSIQELSELNLGLWEGVLRGDLEERFPSVYSQWVAQPGSVAPPDGESLEVVQERILTALFIALRKLRSEHPVVGLVLRPYAWAVVKCWLDQRPLSEVWGYLEGNAVLESFSLDRTIVETSRARKSKIA